MVCKLSVKVWRINIFGFADHMVSVTTLKLNCSVKAATDNNTWIGVPMFKQNVIYKRSSPYLLSSQMSDYQASTWRLDKAREFVGPRGILIFGDYSIEIWFCALKYIDVQKPCPHTLSFQSAFPYLSWK